MDSFISAGEFVTAMLQTSGFITQAAILDAFENFWTSVGRLFFTVAIIGGIMSIVFLGSYRWGRYLMIAPVFFWFLVGERREIEPARWRIHDGRIGTVENSYFGPAEKFGPESDYAPDGKIKVAHFFFLYVKLIDDMVNAMTDFVRQNNDDNELFRLVSNQMLEYFVNAKPEDEELYKIVYGTLSGVCGEMMNVGVQLSNPRFGSLKIAQLHAAAATATGQAQAQLQEMINLAETEKSELEDRYQKLSEEHVKVKNGSFHDFVRQKAEAGTSTPPSNGSKAVDYTKVANEGYDSTLTCAQVWEVNKQAIMDHADWVLSKMESSFLKPPLEDNEENRRIMCQVLAQKINGTNINAEGSDCNLVENLAVFLLRQMVVEKDQYVDLNEQKRRMRFLATQSALLRGDAALQGDDALIQQYQNRPHDVRYNDRAQMEVRDRMAEAAAQPGVEPANRSPIWRQAINVKVEGHQDAAYGYQQRYAARGLMQGVYTYAMNLPYWQGVLFYLFSLVYPFVCLLALVPSRGMTVMYLPLTWLWVKSWDVGFAVVEVLDRVLWNLLPTIDMEVNSFTGSGEEGRMNLPEAVRAALEVDPSYDIHIHRNFLSMAIMAVPAITGYAILKGKSSMLAMFTGASQDAASQAGDLASGAVGIDIMHKQKQKKKLFAGQALQLSGSWGEGAMGGGRGEDALMVGAAAGGLRAARGIMGNVFDSMKKNAIANSEGGAPPSKSMSRWEEGVDNAQNVFKKGEKNVWKQFNLGKITEGERDTLLEELKNTKKRDSAGATPGARFKATTAKAKGLINNLSDGLAHGAESAISTVLAAQDADAWYDQEFHKYYGTMGMFAAMFRGVQAGVDGSGGFEMEDWQLLSDVAGKRTDLFLTYVDLMREGVIDVGATALQGTGTLAGYYNHGQKIDSWAPSDKHEGPSTMGPIKMGTSLAVSGAYWNATAGEYAEYRDGASDTTGELFENMKAGQFQVQDGAIGIDEQMLGYLKKEAEAER